MARLPASMKIRDFTWRLVYSRRRPRWVDTAGAVGCCDSDARRIWVKDSGNAEEDLSTLCHELLHALSPANVLNEEFAEFLVVSLERGLYSVLSNNDLSFFRGAK
jgi:hypothetical protein